jgi:hypothetical protein
MGKKPDTTRRGPGRPRGSRNRRKLNVIEPAQSGPRHSQRAVLLDNDVADALDLAARAGALSSVSAIVRSLITGVRASA